MEDAVAQDAGVVHHAVDATKVVDSGLDDALGAVRIGDAVAVGNGNAAGLPDLAHHLIGDLDVRTLALGGAAEIVHHHLASLGGGEQSDLTPDTPPGAGDDDDFSINALGHVVASHSLWVKPSAHPTPSRHRTRWAIAEARPNRKFSSSSAPDTLQPRPTPRRVWWCGKSERIDPRPFALARGSGSLPARGLT